MIVAPEAIPVTKPVLDPIVATDVLLLLHVPPLAAGSLKTEVSPTQALVTPVTIEGGALTVTTVVTRQPEDNE